METIASMPMEVILPSFMNFLDWYMVSSTALHTLYYSLFIVIQIPRGFNDKLQNHVTSDIMLGSIITSSHIIIQSHYILE